MSSTLENSLDAAFAALRTYGPGSGRGALIPIDHAIAFATTRPNQAALLEKRLGLFLTRTSPAPAAIYACNKLALIGTARSIVALSQTLARPEVAIAACAALEAIPDPAASEAILQAARGSSGETRLALVAAIKTRRIREGSQLLREWLASDDADLASAAAAALGSIADRRSLQALRRGFDGASGALRQAIADALLSAAKTARLESRESEVRTACEAVIRRQDLPAHFHAAARALLESRAA